jgi:opacity protein-like surface antigen
VTRPARHLISSILTAVLLTSPVLAQSADGTWNDIPDRFQLDVGYFRINAANSLRFNGDNVELEEDLGLDDSANTFWLDGTGRLGRRHTVKLSYTRIDRERNNFTLQRQFTWGDNVYQAGLSARSTSAADILSGYYRFAIVRQDRFEIGPAVGIGYVWVEAGIEATGTVNGASRTIDREAETGSVTGAVGAYASGWLTKRLLLQGDFLYIKVNPEDSEASVTDWRAGATYYVVRNAGIGVQYKYDRYRYDRALESDELGGEITYDGFQAFLSIRY